MTTRSPVGEPISSLYLSYKKSTAYAIDWLFENTEFSRGQRTCRTRLSTRDIIRAAELVEKENLQVPAKVLSELKQAIRKRGKIHEVYLAQVRQAADENQNISHQKFIERLEQAYQILYCLRLRQYHENPPRRNCPESSSSPAVSLNRYSTLSNAHIEDSTAEIETAAKDAQEDNVPSDTSPLANSRDLLLDDDLSQDIELCLLVYHLDSICAKVNEYWQEVCAGRLPMIVAAYLTSIAYHGAKGIISNASNLIPSHEVLLTKWNSFGTPPTITFIGVPGFQSQYRQFSESLRRNSYWHVLQDYRQLSKLDRPKLNSRGNRHSPKEYICAPHNGSHSAGPDRNPLDLDRNALEAINTDILALIDSKRAIAAFEAKPMTSVPLLFEVREAVKNKDAAVSTSLVFGMELLLSTYKVYLWPNGSFNGSNSRVAALQFANNVLGCTKECMPCLMSLCQCQDCFICWQANRLNEYQHKLEVYLTEKSFDLFAQAPWSAATQMIEILHSSMFESVTLCCRNNYVAAVLHLYNALLNVNPRMRRVLWLDQVCELFTKVLFPGSLPRANFGSVFRLSSGGRLTKKSNSHSSNNYGFSRGSVQLFDRRVDLRQLSLFYALHANEYQVNPDLWARIYREGSIEQLTIRQKQKVMEEVHSAAFTVPLDRIKDATLSEFQGDLPIADINFFGIFKACMEILEDLSIHFDADGNNKDPRSGFEIADFVLDRASQHRPPPGLIELATRPFQMLNSYCSLSHFSWGTPRIKIEIVHYYLSR